MELAVHFVSIFTPNWKDLKTAFPAPIRIESCKKRCSCRLPIWKNAIIMPQSLHTSSRDNDDIVSLSICYRFDILSYVSIQYVDIFVLFFIVLNKSQLNKQSFSLVFSKFVAYLLHKAFTNNILQAHPFL